MLKKIAFSLISIFLVFQTINLLAAISNITPNALSSMECFLYAAFLNLCATGVFAFIGFVYPTHRLLAESYYLNIDRNSIERIYVIFGVKAFRYLLLLFFWGHKKQRLKYFNGKKSGIKNFIYQTKQSEFGHFAAFFSLLISSIYLLFLGHLSLALWTGTINLIGNFYPIILQRHHRARLNQFSF